MTGNLNTGKHGLRILVIEDKILAMGGDEGGNFLSSVEQFDLSTFTWSFTTIQLKQAREWHAVTTVSVTMFNCDKN